MKGKKISVKGWDKPSERQTGRKRETGRRRG